MKEKEKVCWYCHQATIEPAEDLGHDWLRCSNCGATEVLNPTVSKREAPMETWIDEYGKRHFHPVGIH